MRFKGQLLLPSEQGPGLSVDLQIAQHHLAVVSDHEELGAWPLEAIRAQRLQGDTFVITVAGEDLHFVADDTISFAYSGMPAIQRFAHPSRSRSPLRALLDLFGRDTSKPKNASEETSPSPPETEESSPSRQDKSSPHRQVPIEDVSQMHRLEAPERESDLLPEMHPPSSSGGTGSSGSQTTVDDDVTLPPEPERPTLHPGIETTDTHEMMEIVPEPSPLLGRDDISSDDDAIKQLDQDQPLKSEPTASPTETKRCPALRLDGLPCQSAIIGTSGYCYPHDPESDFGQGFRKAQEARARLISKGTAPLTKVYNRLDKAFRQVERGDLDSDKAMAMAQLARTMCAILELNEESPVSNDEDSPPLSPDQSAARVDDETNRHDVGPI